MQQTKRRSRLSKLLQHNQDDDKKHPQLTQDAKRENQSSRAKSSPKTRRHKTTITTRERLREIIALRNLDEWTNFEMEKLSQNRHINELSIATCNHILALEEHMSIIRNQRTFASETAKSFVETLDKHLLSREGKKEDVVPLFSQFSCLFSFLQNRGYDYAQESVELSTFIAELQFRQLDEKVHYLVQLCNLVFLVMDEVEEEETKINNFIQALDSLFEGDQESELFTIANSVNTRVWRELISFRDNCHLQQRARFHNLAFQAFSLFFSLSMTQPLLVFQQAEHFSTRLEQTLEKFQIFMDLFQPYATQSLNAWENFMLQQLGSIGQDPESVDQLQVVLYYSVPKELRGVLEEIVLKKQENNILVHTQQGSPLLQPQTWKNHQEWIRAVLKNIKRQLSLVNLEMETKQSTEEFRRSLQSGKEWKEQKERKEKKLLLQRKLQSPNLNRKTNPNPNSEKSKMPRVWLPRVLAHWVDFFSKQGQVELFFRNRKFSLSHQTEIKFHLPDGRIEFYIRKENSSMDGPRGVLLVGELHNKKQPPQPEHYDHVIPSDFFFSLFESHPEILFDVAVEKHDINHNRLAKIGWSILTGEILSNCGMGFLSATKDVTCNWKNVRLLRADARHSSDLSQVILKTPEEIYWHQKSQTMIESFHPQARQFFDLIPEVKTKRLILEWLQRERETPIPVNVSKLGKLKNNWLQCFQVFGLTGWAKVDSMVISYLFSRHKRDVSNLRLTAHFPKNEIETPRLACVFVGEAHRAAMSRFFDASQNYDLVSSAGYNETFDLQPLLDLLGQLKDV